MHRATTNAWRRSVLLALYRIHAVLAIQHPAEPDLHSLPVRDHEDVAGAGQGQANMHRHTCDVRREKEQLRPSQHRVTAQRNSRVDDLTHDTVADLPAQHAPGCPSGDDARGVSVDVFEDHAPPPPNFERTNAQRSAVLIARAIAAMSDPPNVPRRMKAPGSRREGTPAQGQARYRAGHGADMDARQDADHQRGFADHHPEDGFDDRRRVDRLLELSAPPHSGTAHLAKT